MSNTLSVYVTDEHEDRAEELRAMLGMRSISEVVRFAIDELFESQKRGK